jgi:hypothetical protein
MIPYCNIHKYTWTSPNVKTHSQIDHVLIDWKWHSSILDVQAFRGVDCDTNHYLVFEQVWERLLVSKQAMQTSAVVRFNAKKLNDEGKEQYQVKI